MTPNIMKNQNKQINTGDSLPINSKKAAPNKRTISITPPATYSTYLL